MPFKCVFLNSGITGLTPKYYFPKLGEGGITPALLSWYKIEAGFELGEQLTILKKYGFFYLLFLLLSYLPLFQVMIISHIQTDHVQV